MIICKTITTEVWACSLCGHYWLPNKRSNGRKPKRCARCGARENQQAKYQRTTTTTTTTTATATAKRDKAVDAVKEALAIKPSEQLRKWREGS